MIGWLMGLLRRKPRGVLVYVVNCSPTATGYRVLADRPGTGLTKIFSLKAPREIGRFYTINGEEWTAEPEE